MMSQQETEKQIRLRKSLYKSIHSAPAYKDNYAQDPMLSEADNQGRRKNYEKKIGEMFRGKRSCKELTIPQLIEVNKFMHGKGSPGHRRYTRSSTGKVEGVMTKAQELKIKALNEVADSIALWQVENGCERFCQKRFGFWKPKTDRQARMLIDTVKDMIIRKMIEDYGQFWFCMKHKNPFIAKFIALHMPGPEPVQKAS